MSQLDALLMKNNVHLNQGHCTDEQIVQFKKNLTSTKSPINKIAEIGFLAGHSADVFLSTTNASLTSFDLNKNPGAKIGLEYIQGLYSNRFTFVAGDSKDTIPNYATKHPDQKFDLIYIDGAHTFEGCLADILNCRLIAHKDTLVWIDDYNYDGPKKAIENAVNQGYITVIDRHVCSGDPRDWVEVKYLFNNR